MTSEESLLEQRRLWEAKLRLSVSRLGRIADGRCWWQKWPGLAWLTRRLFGPYLRDIIHVVKSCRDLCESDARNVGAVAEAQAELALKDDELHRVSQELAAYKTARQLLEQVVGQEVERNNRLEERERLQTARLAMAVFLNDRERNGSAVADLMDMGSDSIRDYVHSHPTVYLTADQILAKVKMVEVPPAKSTTVETITSDSPPPPLAKEAKLPTHPDLVMKLPDNHPAKQAAKEKQRQVKHPQPSDAERVAAKNAQAIARSSNGPLVSKGG